MDIEMNINKVIANVYDGNFSDMNNSIIQLLESSLKCTIKDQSRFLLVFQEIERAMKNKDYLYISDLLQYELLPIIK